MDRSAREDGPVIAAHWLGGNGMIGGWWRCVRRLSLRPQWATATKAGAGPAFGKGESS